MVTQEGQVEEEGVVDVVVMFSVKESRQREECCMEEVVDMDQQPRNQNGNKGKQGVMNRNLVQTKDGVAEVVEVETLKTVHGEEVKVREGEDSMGTHGEEVVVQGVKDQLVVYKEEEEGQWVVDVVVILPGEEGRQRGECYKEVVDMNLQPINQNGKKSNRGKRGIVNRDGVQSKDGAEKGYGAEEEPKTKVYVAEVQEGDKEDLHRETTLVVQIKNLMTVL